MPLAEQNSTIWGGLSRAIAETMNAAQDSIVTVHGGGHATSSGVVWRPGVVVTVRQGLRREGIRVAHGGEPSAATLAGADPGTGLAVLRSEKNAAKPVETSAGESARVGEIVLAIGRSGLGDISASAGIIARLGGSWRTWRGGQIDRLIRPDVRLYVGQAGSALVNEQGKVLGINTPMLARNAVITVPSATVDRIVDAILEKGHVPRPFLGAAMQAIPVPEASRSLFSPGVEEVLLVMHLEPGAPAISGGMLVGDLLLSLGGQAVHNLHEVQQRLNSLQVGDSVPVAVIRAGARVELTVVLADRG